VPGKKSSKRQGQIKTVAKHPVAIHRIPPVASIEQPQGVSTGAFKEVFVPNPTVECRLPYRKFGGPQMPPANGAGATVFSALGSMLNSFFGAILGSLHRSRRLQARRIIRQHRYLIAATQGEVYVTESRCGGRENACE